MRKAKPVVAEDGNERRGRASKMGKEACRRWSPGSPRNPRSLQLCRVLKGRRSRWTGPVLRSAGRRVSTWAGPRATCPGSRL